MARKSLRPHLNQIRAWVRQGRTDAWIAHQLDVPVREIQQFKRQNELIADGEPAEGTAAGDYMEEIDLRAEDDALIAAELEAAEAQAERDRAERAEREAAEAAEERATTAYDAETYEGEGDEGEGEGGATSSTRTRRRGRRGGRRRSGSARAAASTPLEGTFDHGEEGYGLWLDPAIQDNPVYAEHWAGHRPVAVTIEEDRIVIRREGTDD
jgi:hypothetical protein